MMPFPDISEADAEAFLRGIPSPPPSGASALVVARTELATLLAPASAVPTRHPVSLGSGTDFFQALQNAIADRDEARLFHVLNALRGDSRHPTGWARIRDAIDHLAYPPYGSASVLIRASRFGLGSLQPYLRNVHRLLPEPRDMIGLAACVADDLAAPLALLSIWLSSDALHRLIDELADLGLTSPLRGLLQPAERLAREGQFATLWAIRDAGLDLGAFDLAASAQRRVTTLRHDDALEYTILGRILRTAGRDAEAASAFAAARHRSSDALDTEAVKRGFGTTPDRQRRRFARRGQQRRSG